MPQHRPRLRRLGSPGSSKESFAAQSCGQEEPVGFYNSLTWRAISTHLSVAAGERDRPRPRRRTVPRRRGALAARGRAPAPRSSLRRRCTSGCARGGRVPRTTRRSVGATEPGYQGLQTGGKQSTPRRPGGRALPLVSGGRCPNSRKRAEKPAYDVRSSLRVA
jgi:hypothetical protein